MATKPRRKRLHCYWCKRDLEASTSRSRVAKTRDHVIPRCRGGRKTVPCCRQCNQLKGNWAPEYWREVMRIFPQWWKQFDDRGQLLKALKRKVEEAKRERSMRGLWPRGVQVPPRQIEYRKAA